MTTPGSRRTWAAVLCLAALITALFTASVGSPNEAKASSTTQHLASKESQNVTNGSTQGSSASDVASRQALGRQSRSSQAPPDYFKELTDRATCQERPHVRAPRNGGKATGSCVSVERFEPLAETSEGDAVSARCAISPALCGKDSTETGSDRTTDRALATQYAFIWTLYQMSVNVVAWFTDWGVSFQLFTKVSDFAERLRTVWDEQVIARVELGGVGGFVLMVAVVWAGLLMLFHRFRRGFAELIVSVLLAVIAAGFILHPGEAVAKTMETARYFGLTVATITLNPGQARSVPASPQKAEEVASRQIGDAVSNKLVASILVKPHMIANTGKVQTGQCERRYWEMLVAGNKAREAAYERLMDKGTRGGDGEQCVPDGALSPSIERVLVATLLLIMMIVVGAFCLVSVGLLLLSQVAVGAYLAVAPVVAALAPLPGWGRGLLVKWITGLLVAVAGIIASVIVVVVYLNVLGLILGMGESPLANFALALLVVIAGFKLRKRLTSGLRRGARQIGAKLEGTLQRPGGETLVEREQRRHTSTSHLRTAEAVAAGTGAVATGSAIGRRVRDPAVGSDSSLDGGSGSVGFGSRVRNAMSQTKHGRLAVDTTGGRGGSPLPSGATAAAAGGLAAAGLTRGSVAAARTVGKAKADLTDATMPSGPVASERATRAASRVADGSSDRAKELVAEMQRRQKERQQELARRRQA